MKQQPKQLFLASYDYGMGGAWFVFKARSEAEVRRKYPEMDVSATRPTWMEDELFDQLMSAGVWDIDEPPSGALAEYVRMRNRRESDAGP